jgi:hypothetical protein
MIRKALLVALLPIVWIPLIAFACFVVPSVPWWGWVFSVLIYVLFLRRRRLAAAGMLTAGTGSVDGPRFSSFRGSGL